MQRPDRVRQVLLGVLACLAITLSLSATAVCDSDSKVHVTQLTDSDDAIIILQVLCDAINRPNEFNIAAVADLAPTDSRATVSDHLRRLAGKVSATANLSGSDPGPRFASDICGVNKAADRLAIAADMFVNVAEYVARKQVTLELEKHNGHWVINNLAKILADLDVFAETSAAQLTPYAGKSGVERPRSALSIQDLQSNNLFHKKNIFQDYARFTTTTSKAEFSDKVIFGRPQGILAYVWDDDSDAMSRDYLFATDANWHRIIASDQGGGGRNGWITSYGSRGSDNAGFCRPFGIA